MCKHLGIIQDIFIRIKRKYPIIEKIQLGSKLNLKMDLMGALYKRTIDYESTDEVQNIEDDGKGKAPKRKNFIKHIRMADRC